MRDRVVFIPYVNNRNRCNENELNKQRILKKHFKVERNMADLMDFRAMIKTKAVFLAWCEEYLDSEMKRKIMLYKFF